MQSLSKGHNSDSQFLRFGGRLCKHETSVEIMRRMQGDRSQGG